MQLRVDKSAIDGLVVITSPKMSDERGSFSRLYCYDSLQEMTNGLPIRQINRSFNRHRGTVRGLHYQLSEQPEYKVVRCIQGQVIDIIVDLRKGSKSFFQCEKISLSAELNNAILIPPGCAHGFQTLEQDSELLYLHTGDYDAIHEHGVRIDDPQLNIILPLPITQISGRDKSFPLLSKSFKGLVL